MTTNEARRIIRQSGYRARRGAYLDTTDDRSGGWYLDPIDPEPGALLDRRGSGFRTLADAAEYARAHPTVTVQSDGDTYRVMVGQYPWIEKIDGWNVSRWATEYYSRGDAEDEASSVRDDIAQGVDVLARLAELVDYGDRDGWQSARDRAYDPLRGRQTVPETPSAPSSASTGPPVQHGRQGAGGASGGGA